MALAIFGRTDFMVITINGIPGSGKNVLATHIALKHYCHENFILRRFIRRCFHQPSWINNVYTTYPILLKKHHFWSKNQPDIYSNRVTIFDLVPQNRFLSNACIIIDETQAFYDSEEYKDFPKEIAVFNQFHRHFDVANIYYITQHPSRLMKKLRILCSEFQKVDFFLVVPLIKIGFMHIIHYFEFDDYGKYAHPKKEAQTYDVKNSYKLFYAGRVFLGISLNISRFLTSTHHYITKVTSRIYFSLRKKLPTSIVTRYSVCFSAKSTA